MGKYGPSFFAECSSQRSRCYGSIYLKLSKGRIFLWAAGLALAGSNTACLPDAIDELDRKQLVNLVAGESYSIGLWRNGDYPAARLAARVVQIIIQETYIDILYNIYIYIYTYRLSVYQKTKDRITPHVNFFQ